MEATVAAFSSFYFTIRGPVAEDVSCTLIFPQSVCVSPFAFILDPLPFSAAAKLPLQVAQRHDRMCFSFNLLGQWL